MVKKQNEVWKHNSYFGHAALMRANAEAIFRAETTSGVAKHIAKEIHRLAGELSLALKERIDP